MKRQLISVFTPSNTDPEVLERIFVQRHRLLEKIVDRLKRSMLTGDKHHVLLIGPRGSGKTNMVTPAQYRLTQLPELQDAMRIAWLGEDDTITGLIDLALGIADRLAAAYPDEFAWTIDRFFADCHRAMLPRPYWRKSINVCSIGFCC
jgi:hypothetical protein